MARKPASDDARARFARYLDGHIRAGTRPGKDQGEPWTYAEFAAEVASPRAKNDFASPRSISNWCKGKGLPTEIEPILRALFGPNKIKVLHSEARERLRSAFIEARQEKTNAVLSRAKRDQAGGGWIVRDEQFVLDRAVRPSDIRAASDPQREQLQSAIRAISASLADKSKRLLNSPTWGNLSATASKLNSILKVKPENIVHSLGELYALMLALGQFLDTDTRVQRDPACVDDPLDASLHGLLSNLVRLAAPWLRGFPTIAAWDDATGKALARENLFQPAREFNRIARDQKAISERDAAEIDLLSDASDPKSYQGSKAGARAVGDIQNLIIASAEVAARDTSSKADRPLHVKRAMATLKAGRSQIEKVADNLQPDLRYALISVIDAAVEDSSERTASDLIKRRRASIPRHVLDHLGRHLAWTYDAQFKFDMDHTTGYGKKEARDIKTFLLYLSKNRNLYSRDD